MRKYRMSVRGTRTVLDILLCIDVPIEQEAFKDTVVSAVNIVNAKIREGDRLIDPDPWFAPRVQGVDCGIAIMSGAGRNTMTWQVAVNALLGIFKFYTTAELFATSKTLVLDKSLPESQWHVGLIIIGPLDIL